MAGSSARKGNLMRLIVCALLLATAVSTQPPSAVGSNSGVVIFEGARLILGSAAPIERGTLLVENGRIVKVGVRPGDVTAPSGARHIDLTGKTVIPLLVDTHVHLGYQKG